MSVALGPPRKVDLMGVSFDALSERETIEVVLQALANGRGGWLCPINLDVLRQIKAAPTIEALVAQADLRVGDGMPLIWANRIAGGIRLPERVAGSTLVRTLSHACASAQRSIFLLGGNPGVADRAAQQLQAERPDLNVAGTYSPPFGFESDPAALEELKAVLSDRAPDVVFLALGFPKQDRLALQLRKAHPTKWFVSCGISLSFVAGDIHRAPQKLQRAGLEWVHRLVQEPRRLAPRYLLHGPVILIKLSWWAGLRRASAFCGRVHSGADPQPPRGSAD